MLYCHLWILVFGYAEVGYETNSAAAMSGVLAGVRANPDHGSRQGSEVADVHSAYHGCLAAQRQDRTGDALHVQGNAAHAPAPGLGGRAGCAVLGVRVGLPAGE